MKYPYLKTIGLPSLSNKDEPKSSYVPKFVDVHTFSKKRMDVNKFRNICGSG